MQQPNVKAWIVVLTASLFFFYEFIQMNMLDAISQALIADFHINADELGAMSSYYFFANVLFLFVAGTLLDRFSTRYIIIVALGICVIGTAAFGMATDIFWVTVCRFLTGIGSAFCFLSVLRLISRWFPPRKMALATGIVVTIAMFGGMIAQTPFTVLVKWVGWRETLYYDAMFGFIIWFLVLAIVRDYPQRDRVAHVQEQKVLSQIGYKESARKAFLRKQHWLGGIYTSMMNLPINVLGGLWGIMYLVIYYKMSKMNASYVVSMLFVGTIVGSPIVGWVSDRIARRKPPMIFGAILSIGLSVCIIWIPDLSFSMLMVLFFALGFFSSTQIIGYPLVSESSERIVTAMSVSVVNISVMSGIGIIQRLYGYLMQIHAEGRANHVGTYYIASDFHWAMMIFFVGYVLALSAALLVKETYCVQRES